MSTNKTDFKDVIRKIENFSILLPDFQREFVWRDEDQQKQIVASVLARMPIGSVLLLKSKPDDYSSKKIGCKSPVDTSKLKSEVEFLLDGQQRITVLTNVFSNIIHDQCENVLDLISPSLKRRFFLRIPKWTKCRDEADLFGVHNLEFKYQNPDSEDPEFLSGDVLPFIECIPFLADDGQPYNPHVALSTELDTFCLGYNDGYLLPLYLLAPTERRNKNQFLLRYDAITKGIARGIGNEILNHFAGLNSKNDRDQFIDEIFEDQALRDQIKDNNGLFNEEIQNRIDVWNYYFKQYLEACIKELSLNRIVVKEEQRARAIDIYENLNRGGISLNTFDLIMARVAKVSKQNYYKRMIAYMNASKIYNKQVIPAAIEAIIGNSIDDGSYNATVRTGCYNSEKNEISSKYIDAFLDVLSLYCHNKNYNADDYKVDNIKRKQILELTPEQINDNTEKVCDAIDRALFFFQTRCGVRYVQELNYSLMLVLVATIFVNDEFFNDKDVHRILEAWYWASLFSGEYDKDQGVTMISHLSSIIKTIKKERNTDWIVSIKDNVFNSQNFSDKGFLLMEKVGEDRYPKLVLRAFICQFLLAKTYVDMFDSGKRLSVFSDSAKDLEAHHIIPLGTVTKVNESTTALRSDPKNICNSPLNFVLITKQANKEISDDSLDVYAAKICDEAKSALHINGYTGTAATDTDQKVKDILTVRFSALNGDVRDHISQLLQ